MTDNLFEMLGSLLFNAVYMLLYPFISFVNIFITAVVRSFNEFLLLYNSLSGLMWNITNLITSTLGLFFDDAWTSLILLGISIVFILRIYSFVKDISIFGNKL